MDFEFVVEPPSATPTWRSHMDHIDFRPLSPDGAPMAGTLRINTDGRMFWSGQRTTRFARIPRADLLALVSHLAREAPTCDAASAAAPTDATPPVVGMVPIRTCLPNLPRSRGAGTKERP
jgi:hypothetical protein